MLEKATAYLASHRAVDLAVLAAITLLAASGWLNFDYPTGHDSMADMLLSQAAGNAISPHSLLSGWSDSWYLGSPIFYVHSSLVSFFIRMASTFFGWVLGTKLLYLSFYMLSGVFACLCVFELTRSRPAGFAAGLAYIFLPYHVLEIAFEGHHGAFGLPYMLAPLIVLFLERLARDPSARHVLITGLLLVLLLLPYPQVFPFLVGPFLALYLILRIWWQRERGAPYLKKAAVASVATFALPLLLTAFWWLPLLSEIHHFTATSFPVEASREFSATFLQAITLRPAFCCAPASAYGQSGSGFTEAVRLLPFVLAVLGAVLNYRSKYVWFFSGSILLAVLLAMGPDSPVKLFSLAHRCVPFFTGVRTPWRFLLFASMAYAVLIGFCVEAVGERLGHLNLKGIGRSMVPTGALVLTCLIVAGSTWQETRTAFSTFTLTGDQRNAFAWLKTQDDGDYRITDLPFRTWTYTAENRWVINPVYWTYLHGQDNAYGGVPAMAGVYAGDTLEYLNYNLQNGSDLDAWLNMYGVRYVLLDKTDPADAEVNLGEGFRLVWPSATIDIYENDAMTPRVFSVSAGDQRDIALWSSGEIGAVPAYGSEYLGISLDEAHALSSDRSVRAAFRFGDDGPQWSGLAVDLPGVTLDANDTLRLVFYSQSALPGVGISLDALESDGSRYGLDLNRVDGIQAGWNKTDIPVSLLLLRDSDDENRQLDPEQVTALWFGAVETDGADQRRDFDLYFDTLSAISQNIDTSVEHSRTGPGRYLVQVNANSTFRLILADSYYPNWVARFGNQSVRSELAYQSLNGFDLPPGEYDVTLEFVRSPLRTAGTIISLISLVALLLAGAVLLGTETRRRRLNH